MRSREKQTNICPKMRVWNLLIVFSIILLQSKSFGEGTVADVIDVHQVERLVEMLTSRECKDLLWALSHEEENIFERLDRLSPEKNILNTSKGNTSQRSIQSIQVRRDATDAAEREDIFRHLDHLSPEKNKLDLKPSVMRITTDPADKERQCRDALTDFIQEKKKLTFIDRLSRALQQIGRTDIAVEVGKNINQDRILSLKHHVEDYNKSSKPFNSPVVKSGIKNRDGAGPQALRRELRDLTWSDLDLIIERVPAPQRRLLDILWPLVYGVQLCFGGASLIGISTLFIIHIFCRESR